MFYNNEGFKKRKGDDNKNKRRLTITNEIRDDKKSKTREIKRDYREVTSYTIEE